MLAADRKKRHNFCEKKKPQKLRPFLRQLKQALGIGGVCMCEKTIGQCFKSNDKWLLSITVLLAILSWFSVCQKSQIMGWIPILLVDTYLLSLLAFSAIRADGVWNNCSIVKLFFPSRIAALVLVGLFLITLVVGFAGIYYSLESEAFLKKLTSSTDALYFSFVTITTLGYGDFHPVLDCAKIVVMCQLVSGILLLFGIFPLLISRIASFK
jgi:hypothetical protein